MKTIKNFNLLRDIVSTHYGDFEGFVSMDARESFQKLMQLHEVPENRYIVGFGFSFGETLKVEKVYCHAYVLAEKYGADYGTIQKSIKDLDTVEVDDIHFTIPVQDLGKYIKRFDCMAVSSMGNYINSFEVK